MVHLWAAGVWGVPCGCTPEPSLEVGDEDLHAQGWLPACLTVLLHQVMFIHMICILD